MRVFQILHKKLFLCFSCFNFGICSIVLEVFLRAGGSVDWCVYLCGFAHSSATVKCGGSNEVWRWGLRSAACGITSPGSDILTFLSRRSRGKSRWWHRGLQITFIILWGSDFSSPPLQKSKPHITYCQFCRPQHPAIFLLTSASSFLFLNSTHVWLDQLLPVSPLSLLIEAKAVGTSKTETDV